MEEHELSPLFKKERCLTSITLNWGRRAVGAQTYGAWRNRGTGYGNVELFSTPGNHVDLRRFHRIPARFERTLAV
jgi:hypothetical protein